MVSHSSVAGSSQATLVGAVHADGSARPRAANEDGAALVAARRRKERTCPELVRQGSRARLVVLAGEIGGRWSVETRTFLSQLAKARSREEIPLMHRQVEQAWRLRWGSMLACASARAVSSSFWNSDVHMARMVRVPPLMKWTPSSGTLGSRELLRQCA